MKAYKWILCIVFIVVIAGGLFLFGDFRSGDFSLGSDAQSTTALDSVETEAVPTDPTFDSEVFNERLLTLIAAYRAQNNLSAFEEDDALSEGAVTRAQECVQMESKSHTRPDGSEWYTVLGIEDNQNYSEFNGISGLAPEELLRLWIANESFNNELLDGKYISCGIGSEAIGNTVYTVLILYCE